MIVVLLLHYLKNNNSAVTKREPYLNAMEFIPFNNFILDSGDEGQTARLLLVDTAPVALVILTDVDESVKVPVQHYLQITVYRYRVLQ